MCEWPFLTLRMSVHSVPELISDLSLSLSELEHLKETCEKVRNAFLCGGITLWLILNFCSRVGVLYGVHLNEQTSSSIFSANIKLSEVINQTTETVKVVSE